LSTGLQVKVSGFPLESEERAVQTYVFLAELFGRRLERDCIFLLFFPALVFGIQI